MNAAKAPRGRPKGSGINDQQRLVEIGRLMSANPRMKPTTAIKALGISDPSTIRRLRDKFNTAPSDCNIGSGAPAPASHATPPQSSVPRVAALKIAESVKRVDPRPANDTGASVGLSPQLLVKPVKADPVPVAALLFGFGLNAATALFEQQMMIAQSVMKLPQVRDLVRHQIAFTEFMLSVASPSPGSRLTH
jgi:hypothetical protein